MLHLELEDRKFLAKFPELPTEFTTFARPDEIDVDWHKTENQGPIGSCQGNDLTSCLERIQYASTNDKTKVVQLSRIFAYLATQKIDRLLGRDQGSNISGGIKLALQHGVCPESLTGYPRSYPSSGEINRILSPANYAAGQPYKALKAWQAPADVEAVMSFIAGGGAVSIGISWYSGLIPRDRIVRSFRPPSRTGGHAMAVLGYTKEGLLTAVNSHGDGKYFITAEAWRQIIAHRYTAALGITGSERPRIIDWSTELQFVPETMVEPVKPESDPFGYFRLLINDDIEMTDIPRKFES